MATSKQVGGIRLKVLAKLSEVYKQTRRYLQNSLWLIANQIITSVIGFFTLVLVARYLGPSDYGILSYSITIVAIASITGHLGLEGLVVREIVKTPNETPTILGTVSSLKALGCLAGYISAIIYALIFEGAQSAAFSAIALGGVALFFKPFEVSVYWFQACLKARYIAVAELSAQVIAASLRIAFIVLGTGILFFVTANVLQAAVGSIILLVFLRRKSNAGRRRWRFSAPKAIAFLRDSWVIYLGAIFAAIYLKVDQVMLRWLSGPQSVGEYAVAVQLSEAWYFIPTAIVASVFPKLIELRRENEDLFQLRLQQLFDLLFLIAIIAAVLTWLLAEFLIGLLFGEAYRSSANILVVHIWAGVFVFLRTALSRWILIENVLVFSLITQALGAVFNVLLNLFMIPVYGTMGAAIATLISYAIASFFALAIYPRTQPIFKMMCKSMLFPIRYTSAGLRSP